MEVNPDAYQSPFTVEDAATVRGRFLALGLFTIVLGICAFELPGRIDFPTESIIGLILMAVGLADIVHAFLLRSKLGYWLSLVASFLFLLVGGILLFAPLAPVTSLHLGIAVMFGMSGVLRIGKGIDLRPVNNWPWVVASGLLNALIGFYLLSRGDLVSFKTISILVGVSLVVDGWSRMILFWIHEPTRASS